MTATACLLAKLVKTGSLTSCRVVGGKICKPKDSMSRWSACVLYQGMGSTAEKTKNGTGRYSVLLLSRTDGVTCTPDLAAKRRSEAQKVNRRR